MLASRRARLVLTAGLESRLGLEVERSVLCIEFAPVRLYKEAWYPSSISHLEHKGDVKISRCRTSCHIVCAQEETCSACFIGPHRVLALAISLRPQRGALLHSKQGKRGPARNAQGCDSCLVKVAIENRDSKNQVAEQPGRDPTREGIWRNYCGGEWKHRQQHIVKLSHYQPPRPHPTCFAIESRPRRHQRCRHASRLF